MDLDKIKDTVTGNRDKIEEQGGKIADDKLGDNADKAKDGLSKGLDALEDK